MPVDAKAENGNGTSQQHKHNPTFKEFMRDFSLYSLVDPDQEWVIVPEGSFLGYFDWVPRSLRVGPWSSAAICYLFAIPYVTALAIAYLSPSQAEETWWSIDWDALEYPAVGSLPWLYSFATFFWMIYIKYLVWIGPMSYRAWATYTVQSWTLLWVRHGLCLVAPLSPWALRWAEYLRFPVACSATITFVVWNAVLAPVIYSVGMKTAEKKRNFVKFCFSFRLVQLHVCNMGFCWLNGMWASPIRALRAMDLVAAVLSVLVYMAWYLCCMDRLGIHFYPVFSPRVGWLVVLTWTSLWLTYVATFLWWKEILQTRLLLEANGGAAAFSNSPTVDTTFLAPHVARANLFSYNI